MDSSSFPAPLGVLAAAKTWDWSWNALGKTPPAGLQKDLLQAWGESHRHYHVLRHLRECLAFWWLWRDHCGQPAEVAIALWFHDAVYDPKSLDNELKSAAWAARSLSAGGIDDDVVQRVYDLVMDTRHIPHASRDGGGSWRGPDTDILLDIDLAILGSPPDRFETYNLDVRKEHAWVPRPRYTQERAAVLQGFHNRQRIYHTEPAFKLLETQAHANLAAALRGLQQCATLTSTSRPTR